MNTTTTLQQLHTVLKGEQWTRTTFSTYTLSMFKELDDLVDGFSDEEVVDAITISKEHLQTSRNSIVALYIAGLLSFSISEDEDIYLTKLVQLFFDHHRKNLAEHVLRKILAVSENLFALRTLASILEEQGAIEELRDILERIVKVDVHDADTLYTLGNQKTQEGDFRSAIADYKRALYRFVEKKQFPKIRDIWNILVELSPLETDFFYHASTKVAEEIAVERAVQLLNLLYPIFHEHQNIDVVISLLKKILTLSPTNVQARERLVQCYEEKYSDRPNFNKYVQESNLTQSWRNVHEAIADFEKHISFDVDNFVLHKSWGVGIIASVSKNSITINFAKKRGHHMLFNMAISSLEVLHKNHIRVLKNVLKKETLNKKVKSDPMWALRIILASYEDAVDLKTIRGELVPTVLSTKEWMSWGTKARELLRTKSIFGVSPDNKEKFILRDTPLSFVDYLFERFQAQKDFDSRLKRILESVDHFSNFSEAEAKSKKLRHIYKYFSDIAYQEEINAQSIAALVLLEQIALLVPSLQVDEEKNFARSYARIEDPVEVFSNLPYLKIKKYFISKIPEIDKNWQEVLIRLLPYHTSKDILRLFEQYKCEDYKEKLFRYFFENAAEHRYAFVWLIRTLDITEDFADFPIDFERVLILLISIHIVCQREIRNKTNASDNRKTSKYVISYLFENGQLLSFLETAPKESVHKIYTLFNDSKGIETRQNMEIQEIVQKRFPELVKSEQRHLKADKEEAFLSTLSSFKKHQEEFTHLSEVEIPHNSKEIEKARSYGDLRENAEYKAALERQTEINTKINRLHDDLQKVKLVKKSDVSTSAVRFGTRIRLQEVGNAEEVEYVILGPWESDPQRNIISYKSPFGHSLLDKKIDDEFKLSVDGKEQTYRITEISVADF